MFFDTHCHTNSSEYDDDREAVLTRAQTGGVQVIDIATTLENTQTSLQLSSQFEHVYATAGLHPEEIHEDSKFSDKNSQMHDSGSIDNSMESLDTILQAHKEGIIAIGEIGLDYYWLRKSNLSEKEISAVIDLQLELFKSQVALAQKYELPVIIHTRAIEDENRNITKDALTFLNKYSDVKALFHSFTGSIADAKKFLEPGHFISFNGILTFKNADDIRDLFTFVYENYPNQWFLETDGPYLAPEGHRGERNEPVWVKDVYEFVDNLTVENCEERVEKNVRGFFEISNTNKR